MSHKSQRSHGQHQHPESHRGCTECTFKVLRLAFIIDQSFSGRASERKDTTTINSSRVPLEVRAHIRPSFSEHTPTTQLPPDMCHKIMAKNGIWFDLNRIRIFTRICWMSKICALVDWDLGRFYYCEKVWNQIWWYFEVCYGEILFEDCVNLND